MNRKPVLVSGEELGAFAVQEGSGRLEYCLARDYVEETDDGETHWHVAEPGEWRWEAHARERVMSDNFSAFYGKPRC